MPIRWRLAGGSALLTLLILLAFAIVVGTLTTQRLEEDFNARVNSSAADLATQVGDNVFLLPSKGRITINAQARQLLRAFAAPDHAVISIYDVDGTRRYVTPGAPRATALPIPGTAIDVGGYRIETTTSRLTADGTQLTVQYGRPLSEVASTKARIRLLLGLGVLGGALFALVAGLLVARNAMRPIALLTTTARKVARTRDPEQQVPQPGTRDEVGELAQTFNDMLTALADSRLESEEMLKRQRRFVANASHELRTPLTSVLANLELLVDGLEGEHGEAARSALRSTQRMRRLVADLLLLARADVHVSDGPLRAGADAYAPIDLAEVVVDVAAELEPVSGSHVIELAVEPALIDGARDDIHRLTLNLIENALHHTPPRTRVTVSVARERRPRRADRRRRRSRRPGRAARSRLPALRARRRRPRQRLLRASGCRSCARSPAPTAAPSRSRTRRPAAPASSSICPPRRQPISGGRRWRRRPTSWRQRPG